MDPKRFDALTKTFSSPRSRRGVLKSLAALAGAALGGILGERPAFAAPRICDPHLARSCALDATAFHEVQVKNCRDLLRSDPTDPSHSAQLMFSCLAGEQAAYHFALKACKLQRCDASACEGCVGGYCQVTCADGVACIGGKCSGCPGTQHKCGTDCCLSDQACCNHACCAPGIVTCNPDGSCGCPSGQKPCAGSCIPAGQCCVDGDCPSGQVCHGGACQQTGCKAFGVTCGASGACCSGACLSNVCACPGGGQPITVRGEQCCEQPPASVGLGPTCGPFVCAFAVTGKGPGGCDLWCDNRVESGAGCGPDGNGGRRCCCSPIGDPNGTTICVPS